MGHSLLSYERLFLRTNNYTKILKPLISSSILDTRVILSICHNLGKVTTLKICGRS